jgi:hypothetical protein
MFARSIPFVLLLVSSSAMALDTTELGQFGSLSLDEMMPLIDKSLQLKREVGDAVVKPRRRQMRLGVRAGVSLASGAISAEDAQHLTSAKSETSGWKSTRRFVSWGAAGSPSRGLRRKR